MDQTNSQKQMLLSSMQKLIKYIQVSKENQWEIFESLSRKDISKIINNLQDQDSKIRKLSLTLMGSLIHNNNVLRQRLCQRMEISQIPGKICLNLITQTNIHLHKIKIASLVKLLKQDVNKEDEIFPIWVISLKNQPFKTEFIPLTTLSYIDPNDHLVGFTLLQQNKQSPKKTFLSLFGSEVQTSKNQVRKPLFKSTPMTDRISSHSTEYSNRFNRTSQNKTSLKQNMKRSLMVQGTQKMQSDSKYEKQAQRRSNMKFQSANTSPCKSKNTFKYFTSQFDSFQNKSQSSFQGKYLSKIGPSIINNTNIYINGPISEISIEDSKIQVKKLLQQKMMRQQKNENNRYQQNQKFKNENQLGQQYTIQGCFPSGESQCNIFIRPFKKYERKTVKQDSMKDFKEFDYDKYRQFVKNLNPSQQQNK